jgi:hypothetical protein
MKQTFILSIFKTPPSQSSPVIPKPSDSEPSTSKATSTPVRSPSKSPSPKIRRLFEVSDDEEVPVDVDEFINDPFVS